MTVQPPSSVNGWLVAVQVAVQSLKRLNVYFIVLEVEHGTFTPLVLSTSGGWGPSATVAFRRLAGLIATKHNQAYSTTLQFIRCKISFSLIDSASMCLRGPRSSLHAPVKDINFCDQPLDLIHREAQLGE